MVRDRETGIALRLDPGAPGHVQTDKDDAVPGMSQASIIIYELNQLLEMVGHVAATASVRKM